MADDLHAPPARPQGITSTLRNSAFMRILVLAGLAMLLQIPIRMIGRAISERQSLRDEAVREVSSKWGGQQQVRGPVLVVPFMRRQAHVDEKGRRTIVQTRDFARFLPTKLSVGGDLAGEVRYRGIFQVPVYRSRLKLRASFDPPDFSRWQVQPDDVQWKRAYLSLQLSDPRAIAREVNLQRDGETLPFEPSAGEWENAVGGIHVSLSPQAAQNPGAIAIDLELRGSLSLALAPVGGNTEVRLSSGWPDPSFNGQWLPTSRRVSEAGFEAHWSVPALGRDYPQAWVGRKFDRELSNSQLGVALITPVDPYRMSERSQKYQLLFIALTFLTLWLFEVLAGCRIHPMQYLLVGSALCLFYLLELALAEHLGFGLAYGLAAASVALLIMFYSAAVLGRRRRSLGLGGLVCGLYAYLYAVLSSENYALLAGALALLATLAGVMYLTRHTDWYQLGRRAPEQREPLITDPIEEAFEELERRG